MLVSSVDLAPRLSSHKALVAGIDAGPTTGLNAMHMLVWVQHLAEMW